MSGKRRPPDDKRVLKPAPSGLDGWLAAIKEGIGLTRSSRKVLLVLAASISIATKAISHNPKRLDVESVHPVLIYLDTFRSNGSAQDNPVPAQYPLRTVSNAWDLSGNRFEVSVVDATRSEVWKGFAFRAAPRDLSDVDTIEAEVSPISKPGVYFFRLYSMDHRLLRESVMVVEEANPSS